MTEALRNGEQPAVGSQVRVPKMGELVASSLRRQIVRGDNADPALWGDKIRWAIRRGPTSPVATLNVAPRSIRG